jgi:hypothetical protein
MPHPCFLLALALAATSDPPIRLVLEHTIDARAGVRFGELTALDIGLDGSVIAHDGRNGRIYRFFPNGRLRDSLGGRGRAPGEFLTGAGIALGPAGEIVLADGEARRIHFWSAEGRYLGVSAVSGIPVGVYWRGADPVVGAIEFRDSVTVSFSPVRFGTGKSAGSRIGHFVDVSPEHWATAVSCASCRHALAPDGRLLVAAPDTIYRVSEIDSTGSVVRRWIRKDARAAERSPAEAEAMQRLVQATVGAPSPAPSNPAAAPHAIRFHRRFLGLGMDSRGRLLALVRNGGSESALVEVFDAGGRHLAGVATAEPLRGLVVRGARLAALSETSEGGPAIHVYRIEEVP